MYILNVHVFLVKKTWMSSSWPKEQFLCKIHCKATSNTPSSADTHLWSPSNIARLTSNLLWCIWSWEINPPKVLLLCRSWGACVPLRSQRLCQLEFWLLVGTTMLDRLWARGQTKCNTLLMLATSVFGRILLTTLLCDFLVKVQAGYLMAQWRGMHGSCLVPFVMLTPTILRGRVPSWLRWWLGV